MSASTAAKQRPSVSLQQRRNDVVAVLARHGLTNARVFGSVARAEDGVDSDVDLLVDASDTTTYGDIFAAEEELSRLLGHDVDLKTTGSTSAVMEHIRATAVPL